MKWYAITGGLGTGKSEVSRILKGLGYAVVSADEVARQVVSPGTIGLKQVMESFGKEVLNSDGQLDRKKLGQVVFSDKQKLNLLESILHPLIQQEVKKIKEKLQASGHLHAFYEIPLLFEKNLSHQFDAVVVVSTDKKSQIERVSTRDRLSLVEIESRLNAQLTIEEKINKANYVVQNNSTLEALELEVKKLVHKLIQKKD